MNILVIDDDKAIGSAFAKILLREEFTVTAVHSVAAGLDAVQRQSFDAIVCDVALPDVDGTTFYERLNAIDPALAARLVFVSGWAGDERTRKLLQYTGRPFLQKPVEVADLVRAVRAVGETGA